MNICILGAGTYGSYVVDSIQRKYPDSQITVFDIGDHNIKDESEIGFLSKLKQSMYKGLSHGRFFGFGGTSHKWGGQLLTYTENDFKDPNDFMKEIIKINKLYKDECLKRFNIENKYTEKRISHELFIKTGVWISMLHRNFFHWFKINKRKNVTILSNCRIIRLESSNKKKIDSVLYLEDGIEKKIHFDFYFLTSGAFESVRILLSSELFLGDKVYFSDHLSQKMFKVYNSTYIGEDDFVFKMRGTSLITKRIIGEVDNFSYYIHPVFNMKFPFFELIKEIFFYRKFSINRIGEYIITILKDIPHVIAFTWSVIALQKIYVMNKEWFLYIDIENPTKDSYVSLSKEKDKFGLPGLDVYYTIGEDAIEIFQEAQKMAISYLENFKVKFDLISEKINVQTCEDIYHPYGMISFDSLDDYYSRWSNMLVVTTGILPRSGGINPTAAIFPLVDDFISHRLS